MYTAHYEHFWFEKWPIIVCKKHTSKFLGIYSKQGLWNLAKKFGLNVENLSILL